MDSMLHRSTLRTFMQARKLFPKYSSQQIVKQKESLQ